LINRFISSILKIFFKLLYHQFAWAYDWVADIVSIGRWKTWVFSVIPYLGDSSVLELGCGPGHLQAAYSQCDVIFGLDSSWQMLKQASRNLSEHNRTMNLALGMAQHLPFMDGSFPAVVATFPSNYIYHPQTLKQVWRVLQEDGQLIILPAAWITGSSILDKIASWIFSISGESPDIEDSDIENSFAIPFDRLTEAGFQSHHELIKSERSKLLLIHAVKAKTGG
jgi:ubiquinone/menaquinone biosynthesis C-methylase UbiE